MLGAADVVKFVELAFFFKFQKFIEKKNRNQRKPFYLKEFSTYNHSKSKESFQTKISMKENLRVGYKMSQENEESMFVAVCLVSSAKTREYHSLHTTHITRQAQKYPTLDFMKYYMHILE